MALAGPGTRLALGSAALALASAAAVGSAVPAFAFGPITLPAGLACSGFDVSFAGSGDKTIFREFRDKSGDVVRTIRAGKGNVLTFTNVSTGKTYTVPANGSVQHTTLNADGTSTVVDTGHAVIILFPTDVPAGPSSTLYVGRVVYTVDAQGTFVLQSASGRTTDICAALV